MSEGASVGVLANEAKTAKILGNLEKRGVNVVRGERAEQVLEDIGAGAAYANWFGKPHLYFGNSVTRGQLVEELLHHGQSFRRGHKNLDGLAGQRQLIMDEIHAQTYMIKHAVKKGWTQGEIDFYRNQSRLWLMKLVELNRAAQ
jgi:hypothetical protein